MSKWKILHLYWTQQTTKKSTLCMRIAEETITYHMSSITLLSVKEMHYKTIKDSCTHNRHYWIVGEIWDLAQNLGIAALWLFSFNLKFPPLSAWLLRLYSILSMTHFWPVWSVLSMSPIENSGVVDLSNLGKAFISCTEGKKEYIMTGAHLPFKLFTPFIWPIESHKALIKAGGESLGLW